MKDIKKNVGVKRETRTNSESEPSSVYKPRTLKARPVSTKETEENDTTPFDSENSKNQSDDSSNERKSFAKKSPRKEEPEVKSTYKPRTGTFRVSNEDFSAHIEGKKEIKSVEKDDESFKKKKEEKPVSEKRNDFAEKRPAKPTFEKEERYEPKRFSRERKSDDKPFARKEERFNSRREEPIRTSRSIAGKSTGYISSRVDDKKDKRFDDSKESFRRDRTKERKAYSTEKSPKKDTLRLVLPSTGEKKYIDKPIPKPKREYDDKPVLNVDDAGLIRLNKYIANSGLCSRREADEFIQKGMITVNDEVITQVGTKIDPNAEICFKGRKLEAEHKVYILLNKPKDYITTVEDPNAKRTVMELIEGACTERVYPVGRLDRNSTGLLLLTNDGEMTKKLTHPSHMKKKVYHVRLDKVVTFEDMQKMTSGIEVEGEMVKADAVDFIEDSDGTEVGVEIHTGQNRVVRNMFDALGYKVSSLDRVYFAGLTKKNLPRGKWRFLTQTEINMLKMNRFE